MNFKFKRKVLVQTTVLVVIITLIRCVIAENPNTISPGGSPCNPESLNSVEGEKCVVNKTLLTVTILSNRTESAARSSFSETVLPTCSGKTRLQSNSSFIIDGPGNYSLEAKCSWVIDVNKPVRLYLDEFSTECNWDHVYIFDGDSVHSPLLAVLSGVIGDDPVVRRPVEIQGKSGKVLVHFYSDLAFNMTGFNISYRAGGCPRGFNQSECSGKGVCIDGVCTCDAFFRGDACELSSCPNNCTGHGNCDLENHRCTCADDYAGADCSQSKDLGYFEELSTFYIDGVDRASSAGAVFESRLYVVGGYSFKDSPFVYAYDLTNKTWTSYNTSGQDQPTPRHGHTAVVYGDTLIIFGGMTKDGAITNEIWGLSLTNMTWKQLVVQKTVCSAKLCGPLASVGHTMTQVNEKAYIIFGYSPVYGYLNTVQEYNIENQEWIIVQTSGSLIKGGFGHTSVYDNISGRIFVYGGYVSETSGSNVISNMVFSYDPADKTWTLMTPSVYHRYHHTASVSNGLMLILGGNVHNDSEHSPHAKCCSGQISAYDLICDAWVELESELTNQTMPHVSLARNSHLAVQSPLPDDKLFRESTYFFGGFDGTLKSDLIKYTPGQCDSKHTKETCLLFYPGVKCVWYKTQKRCVPLSQTTLEGTEKCLLQSRNLTEACASINSCPTCLHTSFGCVWCTNNCQYGKCNGTKAVSRVDQCDLGDASTCRLLHTCAACHTELYCRWEQDQRCYTYIRKFENRVEKIHLDADEQVCDVPCSERTSCSNCTQGHCMWCSSLQRCVDKNGYIPSFPFGICREWTTSEAKCKNPVEGSVCGYYRTCDQCREDPACGWCDDGSGTGIGKCLDGGLSGPVAEKDGLWLADSGKCSAEQWHFVSCPDCQCNGHSSCDPGSRECKIPCSDLTEGPNCQTCVQGYHGNPVNGGNCTVCSCNGHGTQCNRDNGRCFCTTKGIVGDRCDRCDTSNQYQGDPASPGGSCFYVLAIDYQFTFNLSKKEDRFYTQINFRNTPPKMDLDSDFMIISSVEAKMNISYRTGKGEEKFIVENETFINYKARFLRSEYAFGTDENTTFYVYVYDFASPLWIQVSFSQHPKLDLLQFFITFSTCFLTLLVLAAVLWKIKQRWDIRARRRRLFVEMEQMASRPFAQVYIEIVEARSKKHNRKRSRSIAGNPDEPDSGTASAGPENGSQCRAAPLDKSQKSAHSESVNLSKTEIVKSVNSAHPESRNPMRPEIEDRLQISEEMSRIGSSAKGTNGRPRANETANSVVSELSNSAIVGAGSVNSEQKHNALHRRRKKAKPLPVALEPLHGNEAAIVTLLVRLPCGDGKYTPAGQPGLAMASANVTMGHQNYPSVTKGVSKSKIGETSI